ncbi:MAG TPA: hypothetical protein VHY08_21955, partial [Bacillota bacterium]|nr:hypothetical protein [Bacillota bacterium]
AGHGDWGKLYFGANGSNLTYCNIFYGGSGTLPICAIQSGTTTIDHCNIAHSNNTALNIQGAAKDSTITNNAFYDTTMPLWMSPDTTIDGSNIFHNPANPSETNLKNGIWLANSIGVSTARTWGVSEVPYISDLGFSVNTGATLSIAKGAILKFKATYAGFSINNGASVAVIGGVFNDITFTSYFDDLRGGDSDDDGGATLPAPGNWAGVKDSSGNWVTSTNIHYDSHGNL